MRLTVLIRLGAALGTIFLLARCHGVGSSVPSAPAGLVSSGASTLGSATFTVSPATGVQSIVITLTQVNGAAPPVKTAALTMNLTSSTAGCNAGGGTVSCTATVSAPVGNDMFSITTYSNPNGTGSVVSSTQANAVIVAGGKTNCVPVTTGRQGPSTQGAAN